MLELTFFDANNEPETIPISEFCYERLAEIGFSKKVEYQEVSLTIEDEKYDITATELTKGNRKILLNLIENERQEELQKLFISMDENPTIKEVRESFSYIKELTEVYRLLKLENNIYFSYE